MSKDMRLPIKRVDQLVGLKHLTFQREGVLSVREQEVRTDTEGVGQHDEALIGERPAPVHDRGAARSAPDGSSADRAAGSGLVVEHGQFVEELAGERRQVERIYETELGHRWLLKMC